MSSPPRDCTNSQPRQCRDVGVYFKPGNISPGNDTSHYWVEYCVDARIGLHVLG